MRKDQKSPELKYTAPHAGSGPLSRHGTGSSQKKQQIV